MATNIEQLKIMADRYCGCPGQLHHRGILGQQQGDCSRCLVLDETVEIHRAADEVLQLYMRDLQASVTRPVKELKGFARVAMAAGDRRTIRFTVATEQLAFTGVDGTLVVEPGRHRVMVGTSSADLPLSGEFEVVGAPRQLVARSRFFTSVAVGEVG